MLCKVQDSLQNEVHRVTLIRDNKPLENKAGERMVQKTELNEMVY